MSKKKVKEQLLDELVRMQKDIEQRVEAQDHFINRFQMLVQHEGLFSQLIDNLPYPIAIFDPGGVLTMANKMLFKETNINADDISKSRGCLLDRMAKGDDPVLIAVKSVFSGKTTVLKEFAGLRTLFAGKEGVTAPEAYQSAVFFPVVENGGCISYGVVMLIK